MTTVLDELVEYLRVIEEPEFLKDLALATCRTGSRIICTPPVLDTDFDIVVLLKCADDVQVIEDEGYIYTRPEIAGYDVTTVETDGSNEHWLRTYRKGDINLICLIDATRFGRWKLATRIATALNLKTREERVTLFMAIKEHQEFIMHPKPAPIGWETTNDIPPCPKSFTY